MWFEFVVIVCKVMFWLILILLFMYILVFFDWVNLGFVKVVW